MEGAKLDGFRVDGKLGNLRISATLSYFHNDCRSTGCHNVYLGTRSSEKGVCRTFGSGSAVSCALLMKEHGHTLLQLMEKMPCAYLRHEAHARVLRSPTPPPCLWQKLVSPLPSCRRSKQGTTLRHTRGREAYRVLPTSVRVLHLPLQDASAAHD